MLYGVFTPSCRKTCAAGALCTDRSKRGSKPREGGTAPEAYTGVITGAGAMAGATGAGRTWGGGDRWCSGRGHRCRSLRHARGIGRQRPQRREGERHARTRFGRDHTAGGRRQAVQVDVGEGFVRHAHRRRVLERRLAALPRVSGGAGTGRRTGQGTADHHQDAGTDHVHSFRPRRDCADFGFRSITWGPVRLRRKRPRGPCKTTSFEASAISVQPSMRAPGSSNWSLMRATPRPLTGSMRTSCSTSSGSRGGGGGALAALAASGAAAPGAPAAPA